MARIILKTAKRETSRSRTDVRTAVTATFLEAPSKVHKKSSAVKNVSVVVKRA